MSTNSSTITNSSTAVQAASSSSSSNMKRVAFLKGHMDSVICLNVSPDFKFLASGSEDGMLCIHCLTSRELLCKTLLSKYDAVAAVLFVPNPSSSSSSSEGGVRRSLLFAAAGCELLLLALGVAAAAPGDEQDQQQHNCGTTAAAAVADLDVLCRSTVTSDDISALAVNRQGTYLAAADDAGDVSIFDLSKLQQQQQQQQQLLQPIRVIRSAHAPLASAVSFRSHKPWQLLTAGMDNRIACWDFSRAKKCLASWNMTEITGVGGVSNPGGCSIPGGISNTGGVINPCRVSNPGQQGASQPHPGVSNSQLGIANDRDESTGQLWNPPMVHAMAIPADSSSSGSGSGRQQRQGVVLLPAAVQKRIVAAARGDGVIAVFDADGDAKPSSSSSSTRATADAAAAASPKLNSEKGPAKAHASDLQQQHAAAAAEGVASLQQDQVAHAAAAAASEALKQQQVIIQPGFHVCLGSNVGGHTVPASAVVFLPLGLDPSDGTRFLVSAGEDGRLLLWDWQSALLPQQQQQQQRGEGATPTQQQQASRGTCLLVDKGHKRKVNALCCVPGGFSPAGSQGVAGKVTSQAVNNAERCLLFVADTSSKISVYEVTVRR